MFGRVRNGHHSPGSRVRKRNTEVSSARANALPRAAPRARQGPVVSGMLPSHHVGVADPGDRVLVSSTLHAGYICMVVGEDESKDAVAGCQ